MTDMQGNLGNLMKEAQKMQEKMQDAQKELGDLKVKGEAGAGMVQVTLSGRHRCEKVYISQSLFDEEDKEMMEDLVAAAFNKAAEHVEEKSKELIGKLTSGMQIPQDMLPPAGEGDGGAN